MHARFSSHHRLLLLLSLALFQVSCGQYSRFALRPPLLRDGDDRPLERAPAEDEESNIANSTDVTLLRPISHAFLFENSGEAHNVNSLDEVPDSSWFTNRRVAPSDVERGACDGAAPTPPFLVASTKTGGTTPGFVVEDANGLRFMMKLDSLVPTQPEISTAADSVVSRLYWAIGFNVPCNRVLYVDRNEMIVNDESVERFPTGGRRRLTSSRLSEILERATRGPGGSLRLSASQFIDGEPIGTWRSEGTREDDPNDVIAHEDRRELRGERLLAAWVNHWDSRGPQTFDAFVPSPRGRGGYVLHYFLDFSDSIGAVPIRTRWPEPRMGHTTVSNLPAIAGDAATFGLLRRAWDEVEADPRYPNLGFFGVEHFEPLGFAPQTPQVRWARAQPADLGWMARKIAGLRAEHVRAAVGTGRLSNPEEAAQLERVLMGRRRRILRTAFAHSSPLADVAMFGGDAICATDLGLRAGLSAPGSVVYDAVLELPTARATVSIARTGSHLCVEIPHFADASSPDESAARYAIVEIVRSTANTRTRLRAHLYDLGPSRGHVLVGLERPPS
jgi:hypothetical protein